MQNKTTVDYFKGKKVTVMGLGLLGKRLGDIAFLSEMGAEVLVTDLKSAKELAPSITKLKKYKNITYVLGKHRLEDFEKRDFILKGQGVPLDSIYIKHARERGIPIEMDESLFAKLAPRVKIIGVTGTRGKSTTTVLIYEILKHAGKRVHLGGNIRGTAALPLLKIVKPGDIVVFELSSWQLQGFAEAKISPHISVFTNFMPDHMNYYNNDLDKYFTDKSYIYKFQKQADVLVLGPSMKGKVKDTKSKIIVASTRNIPKSDNLLGKHNEENIACAVAVAKALKISEGVIKKTVKNFKAVPGRMELVKTIRGIKIYNDTNASTPEATSAALETLGQKKNIILILGGSDKNLELKNLVKDIKRYTKAVVLIPGNGTNRIKKMLGSGYYEGKNLKEIVKNSFSKATSGDIILFSPAFTSFGMFNNEYDRGDKFMEIVKKLK
ncbi:MAG: UDP-N-acetylmuramoyl-L-alanine--D-glutamate ligase [Patescibacteria group bacterium]